MMTKLISMLTLLLYKPTLGQDQNALPGVAKLFVGFSELVSGPCNIQPDGCLNFLEGWYMHNGTAGTSDCRTTCIRFPSVHQELKCGKCDGVAEVSNQPVSSTVTESAPFFAAVTMPLNTPSPVDMANSASSSPTTIPSHDPSQFPSRSPMKSSSSAPAVTVVPPTVVPVTNIPSQVTPSFEKLFDQLPAIPSNALSADALSNPVKSPAANSATDIPAGTSTYPSSIPSDIMSYLPSSIPSDMESTVPSDLISTVPSFA